MDDPARVNAIAADVWADYGHLLIAHAGSGAGNPHFKAASPARPTGPRRDLAGRRFGMLTVLKPAWAENGWWRWHCRCDCGRETVPYGFSLIRKNTKSCGCQRNRQPGRKPKETP